jgi:hypothetical protein
MGIDASYFLYEFSNFLSVCSDISYRSSSYGSWNKGEIFNSTSISLLYTSLYKAWSIFTSTDYK